MISIKNVLVATDFSPVSRTALVYGRALAGMFNAQLRVIHVVDDVSRFAYPVGTGLLPCQEMEADIRRVAWEQLDLFVDASDRRELHAETILKSSKSAAKEITDYARAAAVDVIVIGATGRGAIDRMLMGSVAEKVVRLAPCPVLAVRQPEHEFVVAGALQAEAHSTVSRI